MSTRVMSDRRGQGVALLKTVTDITERMALQEKLHHLATTDELSQLNNRRMFMKLANQVFNQARRYDENFCVFMMDIDHFKRVNDEQGHAAGDAVIHRMGELMHRYFRVSDVMGRLGGEEFAVLLSRCSPQEAYRLADRFRQQVADTPTVFNDHEIYITISIGVTCSEPTDKNVENILHRADKALYQSKAEGRNRVTMTG